jgi:hypothetical protein
MLLPALGRAKQKAQGIQGMNNHRQLTLAWKLYADDYTDQIPYAFAFPNGPHAQRAWVSSLNWQC